MASNDSPPGLPARLLAVALHIAGAVLWVGLIALPFLSPVALVSNPTMNALLVAASQLYAAATPIYVFLLYGGGPIRRAVLFLVMNAAVLVPLLLNTMATRMRSP